MLTTIIPACIVCHKMQWKHTVVLFVFSTILATTMAQPDGPPGTPPQPHQQPYANSYPGVDSKKQSGYQPPGHSSNKQSGSSPGSLPYGYHNHKGYGPHNTGYGNNNPYGYNSHWKQYEKCYPNYDTYNTYHRYQISYLESASEEALNTNTSNFQSHPPVRGPNLNPVCAEGPKYILHSEPYEWHWPPVYKGTCDDLPGCKDPKCIPVKTIKSTVCVLVFRQYGYRWVRVGYRKISFETDVSCKCRQCRDIKSYRECVHEHPCPNEGTGYSYCFWKKPYRPHEVPPHKTPHDDKKPDDKKKDKRDVDEEVLERQTRQTYGYDKYDHYGDDKKKDGYSDPYSPYKYPVLYPVPAGSCDCCEPRLCKPPKKFDYDTCECVCPKKKCLPGHKFNPETCKCECPEGTYYDKDKMKCVGRCKEVSAKACENVICKDNPHFYCKLDKNYKCRCPSCEDVDYWQRGLCKKTNCIEQKYKPYCVFDWRNGKCRCPECEDQKTPAACEKTSCLDKHQQKYCKWVWYPYPGCQCGAPHYGPPPPPKKEEPHRG